MNELKVFYIGSDQTVKGVMQDAAQWANDKGVEIVSVVFNSIDYHVYVFTKIV